jgi:polyribonucleotide nucleotidyltransferase
VHAVHAAVATPVAAAGKKGRARRVSLLTCSAAAESAVSGKQPECVIVMGESQITLETGAIARQANGAVLAREGDTTILSTICAGESGQDGSFLPLTVVYQERFSAAGRTSSGFSKRDGRPRDNEVLVSRLVDRPLRPVFPEGFTQDTQILQLVLSWGGERTADALAITAAGAAAAVSDVPFSKPVAGVRVGWLRGAAGPVVNPTQAQVR